MKLFTREGLAKAMGLKIGDRIKTDYYICELTDDYSLKRENDFDGEHPLTSLIGVAYDILSPKKKVGDLKCAEISCMNCPLLKLNCSKFISGKTLYDVLKVECNDDKELYDFYKKRLDQEVEE